MNFCKDCKYTGVGTYIDPFTYQKTTRAFCCHPQYKTKHHPVTGDYEYKIVECTEENKNCDCGNFSADIPLSQSKSFWQLLKELFKTK